MSKFNQEQLAIINERRGALLVAAPVGTGKTTVLVERVAQAMESGLAPEAILCLTFTNRAAEEMKQRLKIRLDDPGLFAELSIFTFHGFCAYFLRQEAKFLGLSSDFTIIDEVEQGEILGRVLANLPGLSDLPKRRLLDIAERFYRVRLRQLEFELGFWSTPAKPLPDLWQAASDRYYQELERQNLLDFNELVIWTLRALYQDEALLAKWSQRYQLVQLDEFQDTHLSEYLVVKQLARHHKNLAMVGDLDQTIYGWRGSQPQQIADLFRAHFQPVKELSLKRNYRSQADILAAAKAVLAEAPAETGVNVRISQCQDFAAESLSLTEAIHELSRREPTASKAVLLRANAHISRLAEHFERQGIASLTVDQYNFFRRQEVRDALAWLKVLVNKYDQESVRRILLRPGRRVAQAAVDSLRTTGAGVGLAVADFLDFSNYAQSEPYAELLKIWQQGRLVVLDTETTGTDEARDEIVQVYAREYLNGQAKGEYHAYIKPQRPVGLSYYVHRLTDEFLAAEGQAPDLALAGLIDFVGSALVVGHNVGFDLKMLAANAKRQGLQWRADKHYDTLDIARRFVKADNYRLSTLAKRLQLASATHSADDDVAATGDLLGYLVKLLAPGSDSRAKLFASLKPQFIGLATDIARWKLAMRSERPAAILAQVLSESGLRDYYTQDRSADKRLQSLATLEQIFREQDDSAWPPFEALLNLIAHGALVRNIDFLGLDQGRVPIVTIHQVKGLEFDYVFLPGLNAGLFPSLRQDSDWQEEKRVFYVALTRAKKQVQLSYSLFDDYGKPMAKSRLLDFLT